MSGTRAPSGGLPREVWVIASANFVIALGFGLVAPALPTFARSFDVSVTAASAVVSAFAFARLAFAPIGGRLATRLGEKRVYLTGMLIVGVTTGACAFVGSYWQLVALRALGGTGSTMFTVSGVALLMNLTPAHLRGRASGLWSTSFLLGTVAGPLVGGGLIGISLRAPFLVYAGALVVAVLLAWLLLRKSTRIAAPGSDTTPAFPLRKALRDSGYRASLASNFATGWIVFGVRVSLVPLFVVEVLHKDGAFAGTALAAFAVGNVLVLMVSGRIADRWGRKPPALLGLVVSATGTVWFGLTDAVPEFLIATVVAGMGTGLLSPPQQAVVADVIGTARGGPVLAVFQMAADVGAIVGPVVAGALADRLSYGWAFAVTGGLAALAVLVWLPARETLPSRARVVPVEVAEVDQGQQATK
ncbi:MFS transporter [Actinokineospora auranticolor]|uniref:Putative MFS family arabinose efflux permease n=1 Tax=Actinokineospora auranticolor TaxID=155976 RepID=A0A2S6GL45_9PSEU|nr:MFS transporter [Actinokineospora auranticolor]PPK65903.1 putative MFS family arabinose efflux permease [Actinokineospora auranticolor]